MARWAALLGLVITLAGALHWWKPFVTQDRFVATSTPSPGPAGPSFDIPLAPGSSVCVAPTAIDPATGRAQFTLAPTSRPVSLTVEANGRGYRSVRSVRLPASSMQQQVNAPLARPARTVTGSVCVRNAGTSRVALAGTNNAVWIGLARTSRDGRVLPGQAIALNLVETREQSVLDRLGTISSRAADLTGHLVPSWLAWILAVTLVVGTPFAIFAAFWTTLRDEP
jgi:hypothetical protein